MPRPSSAGEVLRRVRRGTAALIDWHDGRPRATWGSVRGWVWTVLIAATFFWMSNPLVFVPSFYLSLGEAITWTTVVVAVTLPWLRLPRVPWPWLAFIGLALLSHTWTINEFHTGVSNVVYLQLTTLAVIAAANCEPLVACWGMACGGVLTVGLSVHAYWQELPGASYAALEGVIFTGVGTNKNILAYTLAISLAATLAVGWPAHLFPRVTWLVVLAVHVYGIWLANSSTGYLSALGVAVAAAVIEIWPWLRTRDRRHAWLAAASAGGFLLVAAVGVVTVLGDQLSTFSGRAPFWRATLTSTLDTAPVLGSGWGAVWEHPWNPAAPNDVAADIYGRAGYSLSHGHNFFLDILPELGLVGVLVALLLVAYAVRQVLLSGLRPPAPAPAAGRLVGLTLVALIVFGITEPMLTVPVGWWSFALVVASARQRTINHRDDRVSARIGRRRAE